jgi:hypothetical protein
LLKTNLKFHMLMDKKNKKQSLFYFTIRKNEPQ